MPDNQGRKNAMEFAEEISKELNVEGASIIVIIGVPQHDVSNDKTGVGQGLAGYGFWNSPGLTAIAMLSGGIGYLAGTMMEQEFHAVSEAGLQELADAIMRAQTKGNA